MLTQDGDLEYDPADWPALLAALPAHAMSGVIGDRWAHPHDGSLWRRLHTAVNRALTGLSNLLTGLRVNDMECGFKLFRVPLLRAIRPWLSENRFGVEPQLVAALSRVRAHVAQAPVTYDPAQVKPWEDTRAGANSPWAPIWVAPEMPADGKVTVRATFTQPGTYVLRALADDGALTGYDEVTVTVAK